MPELPEVETVRRQLEPLLAGRRVTEAGSHRSDKFTPAREVTDELLGSMWRRGKFLLVPLGVDQQRELVVHLGMTGRLAVNGGWPDLDNPYLRAWWRLDDGTALEYTDIRRFGRIRVVETGDYRSIPTLHNAGPEPFAIDFDAKAFRRLLQRSKRPIKTQLLSQRPVAGVGNIYADEALWLAQINPKARRLGLERAGSLLDAIREVLSVGLGNGGTTLRDYRDAAGNQGSNQHQLKAYGRSSLPCYRCSASLKSVVLDGRTTTWCPRCQRR